MNPPNASNPQPGYLSTNPTELYTLFDVSTPIASLTANQAGAAGIYNDLGSGVSYGSRIVSAADNGTFVTIAVNASALAAINDAAGEQFANLERSLAYAHGSDLLPRVKSCYSPTRFNSAAWRPSCLRFWNSGSIFKLVQRAYRLPPIFSCA
jgi:hypothetical protein